MKPKENSENQRIIDAYDYLSNAASAQDLTGLIPAAATTEAELESYESIYHFLPPAGDPESIHPEPAHPETPSRNHK